VTKRAATTLLNETSEVGRCLNARQRQLVCLHVQDARRVACSGATLELDVAFVNRCGRRVSACAGSTATTPRGPYAGITRERHVAD
jgi:hypothetical protein